MTIALNSMPGAGTLRRKGQAIVARAEAQKAAARAKLTATPPGSTTAAPQPAAAAPSPQRSAPVGPVATVTTTPPPATGADSADLAILREYQGMSGPSAIQFFLQNEKAIRRARAGVSDTGAHRHLHGMDRVRAAMGIAK
jgi:hypothetical protein